MRVSRKKSIWIESLIIVFHEKLVKLVARHFLVVTVLSHVKNTKKALFCSVRVKQFSFASNPPKICTFFKSQPIFFFFRRKIKEEKAGCCYKLKALNE